MWIIYLEYFESSTYYLSSLFHVVMAMGSEVYKQLFCDCLQLQEGLEPYHLLLDTKVDHTHFEKKKKQC